MRHDGKKSPFDILRIGFASQILKQRGTVPMGGSSLAHTRWDCSYHIIFIPKFRRKVFFKEIRKEVGEILRTLCEYKNVELVKGSISADHVHMYVKIPPKLSVSEFMGYLKGKSALMVFDRFPQMRERKTFVGTRLLCKYGRNQQGCHSSTFRSKKKQISSKTRHLNKPL